MKREYVKPVYIAESYMFNESIATCDISYDSEPLTVTKGMNLCSHGRDGHVAGGQSGNKGTIKDYPTTIFNDGPTNNGCIFDWDGKGSSFANAFYGNSANEAKHAPAYDGKVFFS